jgi:hypothetical protein
MLSNNNKHGAASGIRVRTCDCAELSRRVHRRVRYVALSCFYEIERSHFLVCFDVFACPYLYNYIFFLGALPWDMCATFDLRAYRRYHQLILVGRGWLLYWLCVWYGGAVMVRC